MMTIVCSAASTSTPPHTHPQMRQQHTTSTLSAAALQIDGSDTGPPKRTWRQGFETGVIEFVCMSMFHLIGSISPTAVANGVTLIVLVYYSAKISGAHLNPAVSLTFCILGHITPVEFLMYSVFQLLGAITGALLIAALFAVPPGEAPGDDHDLGCFTPSTELLAGYGGRILLWEAIFTCCFIVPVFSVVWYTQQKKGYGNTGPIIVGLSLMSCAFACGPYTGAALNPARAMASFIVFSCPYRRIYAYVIGEFLGGLVAPLFIAPWYGISSKAWYNGWIHPNIRMNVAMGSRRFIEIKTAE